MNRIILAALLAIAWLTAAQAQTQTPRGMSGGDVMYALGATNAGCTAMTAGGTNLAGATPLTCPTNVVTTTPAGTGVGLSPTLCTAGQKVVNLGANSLDVYPPAGAQIGTSGNGVPVILPPGWAVQFYCPSATQYVAN